MKIIASFAIVASLIAQSAAARSQSPETASLQTQIVTEQVGKVDIKAALFRNGRLVIKSKILGDTANRPLLDVVNSALAKEETTIVTLGDTTNSRLTLLADLLADVELEEPRFDVLCPAMIPPYPQTTKLSVGDNRKVVIGLGTCGYGTWIKPVLTSAKNNALELQHALETLALHELEQANKLVAAPVDTEITESIIQNVKVAIRTTTAAGGPATTIAVREAVITGVMQVGSNACMARGVVAKLSTEFKSSTGEILVTPELHRTTAAGPICIMVYQPVTQKVSTVVRLGDTQLEDIVIKNMGEMGNNVTAAELL